jgi:predicted TIM-barrel fold metal-dependent hydrolase
MADEMQRGGISRALVFHHHAATIDPLAGNRRLLEEISGLAQFSPAWVIAPGEPGEESGVFAQIDQMVVRDVRAARLLPHAHGFDLRLWNVGDLLDALTERNIPVWVDYGINSWTDNPTDWHGLAEVLGALPDLRIVLVRPDIRSPKRLFSLMERHLNLFIETSYYTVNQGLAELCRLFGAERILFGSGLPSRAAGPAITALMYQPLEERERRLIAGENLRRLLGEEVS